MNDKMIARINELYHKSKEKGLSEEEKAEQKKLRMEYVAAIRADMKATLDNVSIKEADGTIVSLKAVREKNEKR